MKSPLTHTAAGLAITGGFAITLFAAETETKITMDKAPAAVQAAVKAHTVDAAIKGIEESDVDGTKVIEFDLERNGKSSEMAFLPDGQLFSTEEGMALSDCPAAVQQAIAKLSKNAKADAPDQVVQPGKTTYEVVIEKNGKKIEYTLSPDGKVVDHEEADKD